MPDKSWWFVDFGPVRVVDEYIDGWPRYVESRACDIVEAATRGKAKAQFLRETRHHELGYTDRVFIRKLSGEQAYDEEIGESYIVIPWEVYEAAAAFWNETA